MRSLPPTRLEPSLPFVGMLWWVVCVEQRRAAARATSVLLMEQTQQERAQRWLVPASPPVPVLRQGRVVGGGTALDLSVTDDRCPGELDQVAAAAAVAEHPVISAGRMERGEVPGLDPAPALVRMPPPRPPVGEHPHVVIQRGEGLLGHHGAVVGRPTPNDRVEPGDHRFGVGPVQGLDLGGEPAADAMHGLLAGFDQQFAVRVTANVEPEEVEAVLDGDDTRLVLVEPQPSRFKPPGQLRLDLLGLRCVRAECDQVVGVADHDRRFGHRPARGAHSLGRVAGSGCCFQPVQGDIEQQRADDSSNAVGNQAVFRPPSRCRCCRRSDCRCCCGREWNAGW